MKIILSNPKTQVLFKDIFVGMGFKWNNWYYMKTEECRCGANSGNAVSLDSGSFAYFDPTDKVQSISMSVTVDA